MPVGIRSCYVTSFGILLLLLFFFLQCQLSIHSSVEISALHFSYCCGLRLTDFVSLLAPKILNIRTLINTGLAPVSFITSIFAHVTTPELVNALSRNLI